MQELDPFGTWGTALRTSFLDLFKAVRGREKGVIIASSQRCGTHLVGAYLKATGIGMPGELFLDYLNMRAGNSASLERLTRALNDVLVAGADGTPDAFSLVLMSYTQNIDDDLEALGLSRSLLSRSMKHLTWVWLRRDWVDVAVSHYFAAKTGVWESHAGDHAAPPFDANEIHRWWRHIQATHAYWERYFEKNSIQPVELDYAELVRDASILAGIAARAGGDTSGLMAAVPPTRMPYARCKQDYAARFRCYLAERKSAEAIHSKSAKERSHEVA